MLGWLLALLRDRNVVDPPDPEPLPGLAGEAELLLAVYEGLGGSTHEATVLATRILGGMSAGSSLAETEAELDAAERSRWMGDAHDWASRALRSVHDGDDPYRETPRPDTRLREAGANVREAVLADAADAVARALQAYVTSARADPRA